jgi:single-strand DNA-binding protein
MNASVNLAIIQGNLGRDPDIRNTQTGGKIANMSIATSEQWKDRQSGERREKTEWVRVCVFNEALVKVIEQYVKKGSTVYVEGELRTRKWSGQDGVERVSTEVVLTQYRGVLKLMGSPKRENGSTGTAPRPPDRTDPRGNPEWDRGGIAGGRPDDDLDDSIPF